MPPKKENERAFLSRLRRSLPVAPGLILGPGDDAALLSVKSNFEMALTCDLMIEGRHFLRPGRDPFALGFKAAAVNLSDLAAMGARPRALLCSLALPRALWRASFLDPFFLGLRAMSEAFGASLAGGDCSASPQGLFIDVTAVGEVEKGKALRRSQARPGDDLYCTGSLGDAAAGLKLKLEPALAKGLQAGHKAWLLKRQSSPLPRILAGRFLIEKNLSRCAIDISDGLASEAWHLSRESKVAIELDAEAIPLSAALRAAASAWRRPALDFALTGGEDYELLFSAPPQSRSRLVRDFSRLTGCRLHAIGRVLRGRGVRLRQGKHLRPLSAQVGFDHFQ